MERNTLTLGRRIKICMGLLHITQRKIAQNAKITESRMSRIVNDKTRIGAEELNGIATALKLPMECLIGTFPVIDALFTYYQEDQEIQRFWTI